MASTGNFEGLINPLFVLFYITNNIQGTSLGNGGNHGYEGCCPEMDVTLHETNEFPFHDTLVKFLDTRAPLPSNVLIIY